MIQYGNRCFTVFHEMLIIFFLLCAVGPKGTPLFHRCHRTHGTENQDGLHWREGWNDLAVSFGSLAPGKFDRNSRYVIFKRILVIDGWGISCKIAPIWMSLDFTDDQSTLVQVMAWCRQAASHYLSQCWPRSLSPYGVTGPEWVNSLALGRGSCNFKLEIF